jgi:hypothetical protein
MIKIETEGEISLIGMVKYYEAVSKALLSVLSPKSPQRELLIC